MRRAYWYAVYVLLVVLALALAAGAPLAFSGPGGTAP